MAEEIEEIRPATPPPSSIVSRRAPTSVPPSEHDGEEAPPETPPSTVEVSRWASRTLVWRDGDPKELRHAAFGIAVNDEILEKLGQVKHQPMRDSERRRIAEVEDEEREDDRERAADLREKIETVTDGWVWSDHLRKPECCRIGERKPLPRVCHECGDTRSDQGLFCGSCGAKRTAPGDLGGDHVANEPLCGKNDDQHEHIYCPPEQVCPHGWCMEHPRQHVCDETRRHWEAKRLCWIARAENALRRAHDKRTRELEAERRARRREMQRRVEDASSGARWTFDELYARLCARGEPLELVPATGVGSPGQLAVRKAIIEEVLSMGGMGQSPEIIIRRIASAASFDAAIAIVYNWAKNTARGMRKPFRTTLAEYRVTIHEKVISRTVERNAGLAKFVDHVDTANATAQQIRVEQKMRLQQLEVECRQRLGLPYAPPSSCCDPCAELGATAAAISNGDESAHPPYGGLPRVSDYYCYRGDQPRCDVCHQTCSVVGSIARRPSGAMKCSSCFGIPRSHGSAL